jgi:putative SOS response-associated peptidase YedK
MCGRFTLTADIGELQARFEFDGAGLTHAPSYNIAPTQPVLAVLNGSGRQAHLLRWGLVPSWARSVSSGRPMINARAETVAERPAFRSAFSRRRCLVLADGYYEWRRSGSSRTPYRITIASGEPFAFAGLWETWRDPSDELVRSCAIITTTANSLLKPIHDRMPVILPREREELWLDHNVQDHNLLGSALAPYPADAMEAYEVSSLVNSVANNGPELAAMRLQDEVNLGFWSPARRSESE